VDGFVLCDAYAESNVLGGESVGWQADAKRRFNDPNDSRVQTKF